MTGSGPDNWGGNVWTLDVAGYLVEDFEDTNVAPHLRIGWETQLESPTASNVLPSVFNPTNDTFGSSFEGGVWDGEHGLINTWDNQAHDYNDAQHWGNIVLEFVVPMRSVAFSVQQMERANRLIVNGTDLGTVADLSGFLMDGDRQGYLRIDATDGDAITSVRIDNAEGDGFVVDFLAFAPVTQELGLEWAEGEGGNGHRYLAPLVGSPGLNWSNAVTSAESLGGYLASIRSSEENAFVVANVVTNPALWFIDGANNGEGPWLGGFQPEGSVEPRGNWQWVTGEPFEYGAWAGGEPNNSGGVEDRTCFFGVRSLMGSVWNDVTHIGRLHGYVVEFEEPLAEPVITSALSSTVLQGAPFAYQITGTGAPRTFNALNLPAGLAVDFDSGLISGEPASAGYYEITLRAANAFGVGEATLALTVLPSQRTSHDLAADWSDEFNPNGVWSLYKSETALFTTNQPDFNSDGTMIRAWAEEPFPLSAHVPLWAKQPEPGSAQSHPGEIRAHGAELDRTGSDVTKARWTSPVSGLALIRGSVWMIPEQSRRVGWELRRNGVRISSGEVFSGDPYDHDSPFRFELGTGGSAALTQEVEPGDYVELALISLSDGGNLGESVGVDFRIETFESQAVPAPPGLLAWWTGDNTARDSIGPFHGLPRNGATYAPGKVGAAFQLDGVDDFVEMPNVIGSNATFSFSFWMRPDSFTDPYYMGVFGQENGSTVRAEYRGFFYYTSRRPGLQGRWADDSNLDLRVSQPLELGVWHHVTATYDGTTLRQYFDGTLRNEVSYSGKVLGNPWPWLLGKLTAFPISGHVTTYFDGLLDEIMVFDRALTSNEVAAVYAAGEAGVEKPGCAVPPTELAARWPLDGNALDAVGSTHGGLGPGVRFVAGKAGQAIQFEDSPDSFVALPNDPIFATAENRLTIAAWVDPDYTNTGNGKLDTVLSKRDGCGTFSYHFGVSRGDSGAGPVGRLYFGSSGFGGRYSDVGVPDNGAFHHVAVVYDGNLASGSVRFYIDGLPAGTADAPGTIPVTSAGPVMGKHAECGSYSTAAMDDLMFFDRALEASEIAAIVGIQGDGYCQPVPLPAPEGLVAWWPGDGDANDVIGGNNGTLENGAGFGPGRVGEAFQFDGANDWVSIARNAPEGAYTFEAWVKYTGDSYVGRGNDWHTIVEWGTDSPTLGVRGDPYGALDMWADTTGGFVPPGEWTHVAYSWDLASRRLYINGALVVSNNIAPPTGGVGMGLGYHSGDTHWLGLIDEVCLYDRALSEAEIAAIAGAGPAGKIKPVPSCTAPAAGLAVWWPAERNGQDVVSGLEATLQGGVALAPAKVGNGFLFDSDDDRVVVAHNAALDVQAGGFTAQFWMRGVRNQPSGDGLAAILDKSHGWVDSTGWTFHAWQADGRVSFSVGGGGPCCNFPGVFSLGDLLDDQFHHVAGTWDGVNLALYVDGVLQGTTPLATPFNNTRDFNIGFAWGNNNPRRFFRGIVDEVAIHQRALSQVEIEAIYAAGSGGMCRSEVPPIVTVEPTNTVVLATRDVALSLTAAGAPVLRYQWFFNDSPVDDATNSVLQLPLVSIADAGPYFATVTNLYGAATSQVAVLTVLPDTEGPGVVDFLPAALLNQDLSAIRFAFDERIEPASLTVADIAVLGPAGALDPAGFTLQEVAPFDGTRFDVTIPTQSADGDYTITIGPDVTDLTGNPMAFPFITTVTLDKTGPGVVGLVPAGVVSNAIAELEITFDSPLAAGTFTAADVAFSGPAPAVSDVQHVSGNVWRILLAGPLPQAAYDITVGPEIDDLAGNPMPAPFNTPLRVWLPDLTLTGIKTPPVAQAGQPLEFTWAITNQGPGNVTGPQVTRVQLATNTLGDGAITLGTYPVTNLLGALTAIEQTGLVILPATASGERWLLVTADLNGEVLEHTEENNTVASAPITLLAPDLVVGRLQAPISAQFGQTIPVTLAVTNIGSAPAPASWSDAVFLSTTSNSLSGATLLARTDAEPGPLPAQAGYTHTVNVVLPLDAQSAPGRLWLVAMADQSSSQPEADEVNNLHSVPIELALPPLPDLLVAAVSAPGFARSGHPLEVAWTTTNAGPITAAGGWSSTVVVTNAEGVLLTLGQFSFTNTLVPGGSLTRTQSMILPYDGPAGVITLGVMVNSRGDVLEADTSNNLAWATNQTPVPPALHLQVASAELLEGAATVGTITRNDGHGVPLEVVLSNSAPAELSLPASVTLPAGQSSTTFQLQALADEVVDGARHVTVTATATNFVTGSAQVTVLDADRPQLTLTLSTNVVIEGASLLATVTSDPVPAAAVSVELRSSVPNQLLPLPNVIIPANAASTDFELVAVDDSLVSQDTPFALTASAPGFIDGEASGVVQDDDLPLVTLRLTDQSVSEGGGPQATTATLTRTPVTTRPLLAELTSSDRTAAIPPLRVTIPANEAEVTFAIAAVDDQVLDGPQTTELGGYILASQTSTRVAPIVSDTLTVTDDDGPALDVVIAQKLLREGRDPATTLTVSRNTPPTGPLAVTLVSSNPAEATVPAEASIPDGQSSVVVPVASVADGTNDGNQLVTFTATAPGYAEGSDTTTVTDTDLPDLFVASLAMPATVETESYFTVTYRVANQGLVTTSNSFLNRVFLSTDTVAGDDTLVGQFRYEGVLPPGQYFEQSLQVRLPREEGDYWIVVRTDVDDVLDEVLEVNNVAISSEPIHNTAAYRASVGTDVVTALAGTAIPMAGVATNSAGEGVAFKPVTIFIRHNDTTRLITAITDESGHYSLVWNPLPGEAGYYELGADHPGAEGTSIQDAFTLIGMKADVGSVQRHLTGLSSLTGEFHLNNLSDLPLTGLTGSVVTTSDVSATVDVPDNLPGSGEVLVRYEVTSLEDEDALVTFNFRFTTAEGPEVAVLAAIHIQPRRARLAVTPASLDLGMVRGEQRLVELEVVNVGGLASSPLTLSLPAVPWLQLASTNPIPSLAPGGTNSFTLQLLPPADLAIGEYTGNLGVAGTDLFVSVPFHFKVVSAAFGDVRITAVDENTYYGEDRGNLEGATVVLRDPFNDAEVARGETGPDGAVQFTDIREGSYNLEVTAPKHDRSTAVVEVQPGQVTERVVFLRTQLVTYRWTVEEIEIEDRTVVTLESTFETFVPTPVVTVTPNVIDLSTIVGNEAQVDLVIENHGLIAANDVTLAFGTHPDWVLTPLISDLGVLPAKSTLRVPLLIQRTGGGAAASSGVSAAASGGSSCDIPARLEWRLVCGPFNVMYPVPIVVSGASSGCGGTGGARGIYTPRLVGDPTISGGGGGGGGSGPGVVTIHSTPPSHSPENNCACDANNFTEQCFSGQIGMKMDLMSELKAILNTAMLPYGFSIDDVSLKIHGGGKLCTCCQDNVQGLKAEWEAGATIEAVVIAGFSPNFETTFDVTGVGEVRARAQFIAGVVFTLTGSLKGNGTTECFFENPQYCWSMSAGLGVSPQITGKVILEASGPNGETYGGEGVATAALSTGVSIESAWCNGDPNAQVTGKVDDLVFTAGITGELKLGEMGSYVNVNYTYTKTIAPGGCIPSPCPGAASLDSVAAASDGGVALPAPFDPQAGAGSPVFPAPTASEPVFLNIVPFGTPRAAMPDQLAGQVPFLTSQPVLYLSKPPVPAPPPQPAQTEVAAVDPEPEVHAAAAESGVCAQVRLRIEQEAVLTRKGVGATLEIFNQSDTLPLEALNVTLSIYDADGNLADDRFVVLPPELSNIEPDGNLIVGSEDVPLVREVWRMPAATTGVARWVILPLDEAAPEAPKTYYVGGIMSYTSGAVPTATELLPSPVQVYPNPRLRLHYFHERDVFSDDPFTDVVEPSVPFNLAVLAENIGGGVARNFHITSAQPKIVDNEKGLLIDFQIIASEVAGQSIVPSLTANFGDIEPGSTVVGRWLLTSTLQGLFVDYRASFEHDDALGGRATSLIDDVSIHEMIHLVRAGGAFEDGEPDFLVNDESDPNDRPDTLWLSDGTTQSVRVVEQATSDATPDPGRLHVQLTAPLPDGWAYLRVPEPSDRQLRLIRVIRSDGKEIPMNVNVWTTDRTFIGVGRRPIRENILHLLDHDSTGVYTLDYAVPPVADTASPTSVVESLPTDSREVFPVHWSGSDDSGKVDGYDVMVSVNGGAFIPWLQRTRLTTAVFQGELGGEYAFYTVATDASGNRESPPATPDALTRVTLINHAPIITPTRDQEVDEGEEFVLAPVATDEDLPGDRLTFSLVNAPAGMRIDSANGRMVWATGEAHGPGSNVVTWAVQDNGIPPRSATNTLTLIVREVNTPPLLAALTNHVIPEGFRLVITNHAQDTDIPVNGLRFSLGPEAPSGADIDADSGVFRWQPSQIQGPSTNLIQVIVTDDGVPPLSATQQFSVVVQDVLSDFTLAAGSTNLLVGETSAVPLLLNSGIPLTNLSFSLETDTDRLVDVGLRQLPAEVRTFLLRPAGPNLFHLNFEMNPDLMVAGERPLADLGFAAQTNHASAIVPLRLADILGLKRDGTAITNASGDPGRVIVVNRAPVLEVAAVPDARVTIYGRPGTNYVLEVSTNLSSGVWLPVGEVQLDDRSLAVSGLATNGPMAFFRAKETTGQAQAAAYAVMTDVPVSIQHGVGPMLTLEAPQVPGQYELLTATNLGADVLWMPAGTLTVTNGTGVFHWTNQGDRARFFRVRPVERP